MIEPEKLARLPAPTNLVKNGIQQVRECCNINIGKCEEELPVRKNQAPWIIIEFIPLGKQGICLEPISSSEDI
jgi:hypothetical protein